MGEEGGLEKEEEEASKFYFRNSFSPLMSVFGCGWGDGGLRRNCTCEE